MKYLILLVGLFTFSEGSFLDQIKIDEDDLRDFRTNLAECDCNNMTIEYIALGDGIILENLNIQYLNEFEKVSLKKWPIKWPILKVKGNYNINIKDYFIIGIGNFNLEINNLMIGSFEFDGSNEFRIGIENIKFTLSDLRVKDKQIADGIQDIVNGFLLEIIDILSYFLRLLPRSEMKSIQNPKELPPAICRFICSLVESLGKP